VHCDKLSFGLKNSKLPLCHVRVYAQRKDEKNNFLHFSFLKLTSLFADKNFKAHYTQNNLK
jgi:hypothetical protein